MASLLLLACVTMVAAQAPAPGRSYGVVWEAQPGFAPGSGAYVGNNQAQQIKSRLSASGMQLTPLAEPGAWVFGLALTGYGHAGDLQAVSEATPRATANRVDFVRTGDLSEWYINDPAGVQQWLSLSAAPPDSLGEGGPLTIEFALTTGLAARLSGASTILDLADGDGRILAQYNVWRVTNASGQMVPAELRLAADDQGTATGVTLVVFAAADDYPLSVGMAAGSPKTLTLPPPSDFAAASPQAELAPLAAPANDLCAGAEVIPAGSYPVLSSVTADITDATTVGDPPAPSCQSSVARSIWYTFTPTATAKYTISLCADAPTGTTVDDTVLAVYTSDSDCTGTFTQVLGACDDDACGIEGLQSVISGLTLTSGTTYYILAHQSGLAGAPAAGDTAVQVQISLTPVPANDTCFGAIPLFPDTITSGTVALAVNDHSLTGTACFQGIGNTASCTAAGRDVVYSFTAPAAGAYSFKVQTTDAAGSGNWIIYTAPSCVAGARTCASPVIAANRNNSTAQYAAADEVWCQSMTAGQSVFVFVDECTASTQGGGFTIEVNPCVSESGSNDTPATANTYGFANSCPMQGAINPTVDLDFFSIGSPAAGSRVFAIADTVQQGAGQNADMRVTTDTTTLQYDDRHNATAFGASGPNVNGTPISGTAPYYIRMNYAGDATVAEPYRLYAVVQPASTSAIPEINDATNNTLAGANSAGNLYFSGSASSSSDLDLYRFAARAGDVIHLGVDLSPSRSGTALNAAIFLFDAAGTQLLGLDDTQDLVPNYTAGATLTASTPTIPGEAAVWRARYTGVYYAGVAPGSTGTRTGPYLLSIALNCQTGASQSADLALTKDDAPDPVAAGSNLTYTMTMTNAGPNIALDANLLDPLPAGTTFVSLTASGTGGNWSCTVPPVGSGGTISCTNPAFDVGGSFTFVVTVRAAYCLGNETVLTNTATASSKTSDSNPSDNVAISTTTVTNNVACDDGSECTTDSCDALIGCVYTPVVCDDEDGCTADSCDPSTGCEFTLTPGAACDDGDACTTGDLCDGTGACIGGPPPDCDDSNLCTVDACDLLLGCVNDPEPANGFACGNAGDTNCDNPDSCLNGACAPNYEPSGFPCSDGNACTTTDTCDGAGLCVGGPAPNCDDNNPCTVDSCDTVLGCVNDAPAANGFACGSVGDTDCDNPDSCLNGACAPNYELPGIACSDGNACTTPDRCDGAGLCVGGPAPSCDDTNACTLDTCDAETGSCVNTPITCDDDNPCTANSCDALLGCVNTLIDAGSTAVPPEVTDQVFLDDKATQTWTSLAGSSGPSTVYDVLRGALNQFPVGSGGGEACIADSIGETSYPDGTEPLPGEGFWYLVRGQNACGTGTYGFGTLNGTPTTERVGTVCP